MTVRSETTFGDERNALIAVLTWRVDALLAAGYSRDQARDLAADLHVDVHRAVELVKAGCPHGIAARILL